MQQVSIELPPFKRGFHIITNEILNAIDKLPEVGICNVFIQHTSAGLTINEAADPSVLVDFESSFNLLFPENAKHYVHTQEGIDDMPAHLKTAVVNVSLNIPITKGQLNLGTWQGIYLCEFRNRASSRKLIITVF